MNQHLSNLIEKKPGAAEYLKSLDPLTFNSLYDKDHHIGSTSNSVNKPVIL